MKIGILLLDSNDCYVDENGQLPARPDFDKSLLLGLLNGKKYVCSDNTYDKLPMSLKSTAVRVFSNDFDFNLGISTLSTYPVDKLMVIRATQPLESGKRFRLENWSLETIIGDRINIYIPKDI